METRTEAPEEAKHRAAVDLGILLGYMSNGMKISVLKRYVHFHFHCSIIFTVPRYGNNLSNHHNR